MTTPLERAADAIRREMSDIDYTLDSKDADRFFIDLADAALGAARLPEQLDVATEMRTANMIALMDHLSNAINTDRELGWAGDPDHLAAIKALRARVTTRLEIAVGQWWRPPVAVPADVADRLAKEHPTDFCEGWR